MAKCIGKLSLTVFILLFAFPSGLGFAAQANEPAKVEDSGTPSPSTYEKVAVSLSGSVKKDLIEDSAFHQFIQRGKDNLGGFGQQLAFVYSNYPNVTSEIVNSIHHLTGGKGFGELARITLLFLLLIAVGFGAETIVNIPLKQLKQRLEGSIPDCFFQLAARLSARAMLELAAFAVFALTIVGFYLLFYPTNSPLYEVAMVYLPPIFFIRLAFIALNTLYSPKTPHMRISPQDCLSSATYFLGLLAFIVISLFVTKTLLLLKSHGMSEGVFLLLYSHLGILQFFILLTIPWMDRKRINRIILNANGVTNTTASSSSATFKRMWFPMAIVVLLGFEILWQVNLIVYKKDLVLPLLLTILSIPFGFLLFSIGNRLLHIAAGQTELMDPRVLNKDIITEGMDLSNFLKIDLPPEPISAIDAENHQESLFERNLKLIQNMMAILIFGALFFWILNLWGLDLPLGRSIVQSAASIFTTLLLAYVVWEISRTIIDRKLEEDQLQSGIDPGEAEEGGEGSRKGTLLTLLRKVIMLVLGVTVTLLSLHAVGINIGPLLAGAGILGLAVGFGSQTLVRDILSGVFFLLDDAFRVGDYIQTAGTKGMVEYISIRSLRLRHPRGMVYTIPFGDMGSVQNFSRDYIITKLDVRVRYDADVDKIRKIVKKINKELQKHEEIGPLLLSKIKSQGVREMDDSAMILRVKFKTKPGDQFVVRRELYRRIQERFQEAGVEFAHKNVTVYLPTEDSAGGNSNDAAEDPSAPIKPDRKLIEAAAAAAIAAAQMEGPESEPSK